MPLPIAASRTLGQVKESVVVSASGTMALAADSTSEHAVPTPSVWLTSHARTTWVAFPPLQVRVTVDPAAQAWTFPAVAKPQSRFGPIWPRSHGSVTKLPPGEETWALPTLPAFQLLN